MQRTRPTPSTRTTSAAVKLGSSEKLRHADMVSVQALLHTIPGDPDSLDHGQRASHFESQNHQSAC